MNIETVPGEFSICKVPGYSKADLDSPWCFISKTDTENSLVCLTDSVPADAVCRDDGWRAFRIQGILDFSLTGVLAALSAVLADRKIGIFAVSTYNTDYIFTRSENFSRALAALSAAGYDIAGEAKRV